MKVKIDRDENSANYDKSKVNKKNYQLDFQLEFLKRTLLTVDVISVQCGALSGKLHRNLFICPGIHENCIEFEGTMISPRNLAIKANLGKQKDWKGSIRCQKKPLRYFFDNHLLDFYEHDLLCTGKCVGKSQPNYHESQYPRNIFGPRLSVSAASANPLVNMPMPGLASFMPQATVTQQSHLETMRIPAITPFMIHNTLMNSFSQNPAMFWFEAEKTGVLKETIDRLVDSIKELGNSQNPVSNSLLSKVTALFGLQLETVSQVYERVFATQMAMIPAMPDPSQLQYPFQIPPGPSDHFAPKKETSISPKSTPVMKNPNELLAAMASAMIPSTSQASATIEEQNVAEQPQPKYSPYF